MKVILTQLAGSTTGRRERRQRRITLDLALHSAAILLRRLLPQHGGACGFDSVEDLLIELERELRRRLGDPRLLYRALRRTAHTELQRDVANDGSV